MGKDYIENLSGPKELLSQERLNAIAAEQDLTVVVPPDDVLILDLDPEEAYRNFLSYFRLQHGIDPVSCLFETNAEINRVNKFLRKDKEFYGK